MSFDDNNFDDSVDDAPLPEESNNNRTFMIAVGILGGIILISIACLGGVYLFSLRNKGTAAVNTTATVDAANTFIAQALTLTATAAIQPTATSTTVPTSVVSVATVTNTPDPAIAAAVTGNAGTPAAATATVGAALTQAAAAQATALAQPLTVFPSPTALANGGFADDYGLPGLVVMALAFVIVILLARRLRVSPSMNR